MRKVYSSSIASLPKLIEERIRGDITAMKEAKSMIDDEPSGLMRQIPKMQPVNKALQSALRLYSVPSRA